jgi:hypothetical protein
MIGTVRLVNRIVVGVGICAILFQACDCCEMAFETPPHWLKRL